MLSFAERLVGGRIGGRIGGTGVPAGPRQRQAGRLSYLLSLGLLLALAEPAWAHALGVECKLRRDQVEVLAYFDDKTPARKAEVKVRDGMNQVMAQGETDGDGRWRFPRPDAGQYRVEVNASGGHRAETAITIPPRSAAAEEDTIIGEGPSREEFTRFPWTKALIGVAAIVLFFGAIWLVRRRGSTGGATEEGLHVRP